ncbi:hypothetical protein [Arthrobacter cupressi]
MPGARTHGDGAILPVEPAPDGVMGVRGGVGGISFQFEELLAGANALDGVVRELDATVTEIDAVRRELFLTELRTFTSGGPALAAINDGAQGAGQVRDAIRATGEQVRASYREYEYTEALNAITLRAGLLHPPLLEMGVRLGQGGLAGTQLGDRDRAEQLVAQLPLMVGSLLGAAVPGSLLGTLTGVLAGQTDVRAILRAMVELPGMAHLKPRPVTVQKVSTTEEPIDTSLPGLVRRAEPLHSGGEGEIAVIKVPQDEGGGTKSAWVVVIPGTQKGAPPGGSNPIDEGGIVDALAYDSAYLTPAIRKALREAGAEAGENVVAVGHSQGGVHAMNLAANKAFLAEFDLKYVFTAGSPVGGIKPEPGISSLHLEHSQDWVPGCDGAPNADTKDRVTVTLNNPVRTVEGEDPGLGPGHKLKNYAEGAELVAASSEPSLTASTAALAGALGAGGAAVAGSNAPRMTVTRFKLTRESMPTPAPAERVRPRAPENRSEAGWR